MNKNYVSHLAFQDNYDEEYLGKKWFWQIPAKSREKNPAVDLSINEVPKLLRFLFRNNGSVYIPEWILGEAEIPLEISSFVKNDLSLVSNIRKIKRAGFLYEVTDNNNAIDDFFKNMYLPYITKAHGNRALAQNYAEIKSKYGNCKLLLVKKGLEAIAGMLLFHRGNNGQMLVIGVKNGNMDHVRDGAVGALYYFTFCYFKENNCQTINIGTCRAFLNDGVLKYKRRWQQKINGSSNKGFLLNIWSLTPAVRAFLVNNPYIFLEDGELKGAIYVESAQEWAEEDYQKIYKNYFSEGLTRLCVYSLADINASPKQQESQAIQGKINLYSIRDLVAK